MRALRKKAYAVLGAGLVFQMGGCTVADIVGDTFNSLIPGLVSSFVGG